MTTRYEDRLRVPIEGNDHTRFETSTGLHVATGYTRIVIGGRGPYIEFLPGQLIWENLHIPEEQKHRKGHSWEDQTNRVEWRTKDASRVKVYEQNRRVAYADYRIGLLYISKPSRASVQQKASFRELLPSFAIVYSPILYQV